MGDQMLRPERVPEAPLAAGRRTVRRPALSSVAVLVSLGAAVWIAVAVVVTGVAGGALAALALLAGLGVWWRPVLLGAFTALALPVGRLVELPHVDVSPLEAVVGGGALAYLAALAARRERLRVGIAQVALVVFAAWIALSTLGPADAGSQLRAALTWAALAVVFHAVTGHARGAAGRRLLFAGLAGALVLEAVWAIVEYLTRWSDRFSALGGAIVYPLPRGTLEHANALAQFLVLAGLTLFVLAAGPERRIRMGALGAAALAGLALVVTYSRASWLAAAGGAAVYTLDRRARRLLVPIGAAVAVLAAGLALTHTGAIGERIATLYSSETGGLTSFRLELAERAAEVAADHPLAGAGRFEEVGLYAGRPDLATHPHNLFLGIAVFFGIPAAVAFAVVVLAAARPAWRAFRVGGPTRRAGVAALALLVALLVNGLFEYPFWNVSLSALVVLSLAVAAATSSESSS